MVVGALLVPTFVSATAFFINFIAIYYQAAKAIHFTSMVKYLNLMNCIHLIKNRWFNCVLKLFQVGHSRHLYIHNIAMQFNWYFIGPRSKWTIKFSMPYQCGATTNTRKEMVYGTIGDHSIWRPLAVRLHLYWSVNKHFFLYFTNSKLKSILFLLAILYLPHFGRIRSTTYMALCFWYF